MCAFTRRSLSVITSVGMSMSVSMAVGHKLWKKSILYAATNIFTTLPLTSATGQIASAGDVVKNTSAADLISFDVLIV